MQPSKLLALALLGATPALSCLHLYGQGAAGLGEAFYLTADDNGVQTCDIQANSHATGGTGSCIDGFSISWSWPVIDGPAQVHYCNPSTCFDVSVDQDCNNYNCCGGGKLSSFPML